MKANPAEVAAQFSPALGIPAPILEVAVGRQAYGVKPIDDEVVAEQQKIADTFFELGLIPKRDQDRRRRAEAAVVTRSGESERPLVPADAWRRPLSRHRDGGRPVDLDYLHQIAQAADDLGYFGVLLPTGKSCEDSWMVASALAPLTERLRFLVAVRPGLQTPTVAARMTATLDRISGGRLLINVVTGGDPVENKGDGLFLSHDERYAVTREFLDVYRALLAGETVNYSGQHIRVEDGRLLFAPVQKPHPPLYFGGSSDAGIDVAAEQVDKYLTWGEPPGAGRARRSRRSSAAGAQEGRSLSFGIRLHVIVRETSGGGLGGGRQADQPSRRCDDRHGAERLRAHGFGRPEPHGGAARRQARQARGQPQSVGGVGLVRGGAGTALVGDPETVAARMKEYMALGIDTFILSGYPHLEEAYRFAELVFPLLPLAHGSRRRRAVSRPTWARSARRSPTSSAPTERRRGQS